MVRHGATVVSAEDRFAGATDVELSDQGREQAQRLAERLSREKIASVYASPLGRALETAKILAAPHNLEVQTRDALREIVARTGVDDLSTFVSSVIQADQLGVSIAKVLRIQSEQMRIRRRQRAEEQAHKAPILMMIPMVFLIFPATYIVILGPSVPQLLNTFGSGGI